MMDTRDHIDIVHEPIDCARLLASVADPSCGATVLFLGTTRNYNAGREVVRLEYEAYEDMAEREMAKIAHEAHSRWQLGKITLVHRLGTVPLGEASVAVAVSAPHRADAFAAAQFAMDAIKTTVPIWKKEHFAGGEVWIGLQGTGNRILGSTKSS